MLQPALRPVQMDVAEVDPVGHEDVKPPVSVDVGACHAAGGAQVRPIAKGRIGDVAKRAVAIIVEKPVLYDLREPRNLVHHSYVLSLVFAPDCAHVQVLVAVVVEVTGGNAGAVALYGDDARLLPYLLEGAVTLVVE